LAKPAPEYELVLMLDPESPDDRREQLAGDARKRIESSGTLKQDAAWGMRKMAYEIRQRTEADYRFFRFQNGGSLLDELNHNLRIADGVLRFRIFKVDPASPAVEPPPPVSLAASGPPRGRRDDGPQRDRDEPSRAAPAEEAPAQKAPAAEQPEQPPAAEAPAEAAEEPAEAAEEPAEAAEDQ
jgi:small subunit ribosomal protein S6